jgi:hypothetical protein
VEWALGVGGTLHYISDWGSKLSAQIARIAAIFHVLDLKNLTIECLQIGVQEVSAAWQLAPYLEAHAQAAFDLMDQGSEFHQAERILAWIKRRGHESFKRAACYQAVRRSAGINRSEDVTTPLQILEAYGYIVERNPILSGKPGRPKSAVYDVNPAVHTS